MNEPAEPAEPAAEPAGPAVTWWAVFHYDGKVYTEPVHWLTPPEITPGAYAAKRLYWLSMGLDELVPVPPAGEVRCEIYDKYDTGIDDIGPRPGTLLGQAGRMFRPTDPVYTRGF